MCECLFIRQVMFARLGCAAVCSHVNHAAVGHLFIRQIQCGGITLIFTGAEVAVTPLLSVAIAVRV